MKKIYLKKQERVRQKKLKNNLTGVLKDGLSKTESNSPVDLYLEGNWSYYTSDIKT
ncbi:DUF6366 family protein [Niallia circulans]|uniref:DUF6366 family protein n=1 Tax=Niallia circulans TaxID=1397 RepID=UPI003B986759